MDKERDISVVVFANRKDFFFTKICIASIRYYYPDIEIFLVKDKLNGNFTTKKLRKIYNVKLLKLGKNYFGWSAGKMHFLSSNNLESKRYLCLDSDIIFIGKVIERLENIPADFVVNPHYLTPPFSDYMKQIFLNPSEIKEIFSDYEYPGYFFNAGQMVVTPGLIPKGFFEKCFDFEKYPYYKNQHIFRTVDQSILNAAFPVLGKRKEIELVDVEFMKLSIDFFANGRDIKVQEIRRGTLPYLVHYAGDVRDRQIDKMRGKEVLKEFKKLYYSNLSFVEKGLDKLQDILNTNKTLSFFLLKKNRVWIEIFNKLQKIFQLKIKDFRLQKS